jgi:hypothetical protein
LEAIWCGQPSVIMVEAAELTIKILPEEDVL